MRVDLARLPVGAEFFGESRVLAAGAIGFEIGIGGIG
jgi:hypothetical protein